VTFRLHERGLEVVLLDIEGTTTPISFVYEVLFPYARADLPHFVRAHLDDPHLTVPLRRLHDDWLEDVRRGDSPPRWDEENPDRLAASMTAYALWLMDRDRKAPGLKALQGHIWARAYEDGIVRGEVFPDVPPAFERWHAEGILIAIYSSGSVLAQQMLFRTAPAGDLTRLIDGFFDTSVGPKISAESYRQIAAALRHPTSQILFVSDTPAELDAAREAGCAVLKCVRADETGEPEGVTIHSFDEIC
jgi:enolase-phosphatase E1